MKLPRLLLLANVCSLPHKTDELAVILQTNNIDICGITETWLNQDIPTQTVDIDGYIFHRCDRNDSRQGGGVACYVRQNLPFSLVKPVVDDAENAVESV